MTSGRTRTEYANKTQDPEVDRDTNHFEWQLQQLEFKFVGDGMPKLPLIVILARLRHT